MKGPRLIHYHVGSHKTGTSYIQSRIFENVNTLEKNNMFFFHPWSGKKGIQKYRAAVFRAIDKKHVDYGELSEAASCLQYLARSICADNLNEDSMLLASAEYALGNYDVTQGIYPHAKQGIEHIVQAFPDSEVRVFFAFRSFDRWLESGYVQRVFGRHETRGFREYIDAVNLDQLSWVRVIEEMESVVGKDRVFVWAYEDFSRDEAPFWRSLLGNYNWKDFLPEKAVAPNPSLSTKGLDYRLYLNRFVGGVSDKSDRAKFEELMNNKVMLEFFKNNYGVKSGLSSPRPMSDDLRSFLKEKYDRQVSHICESSNDIYK